jgi:glutamate-5-semialdehyde dehydrogenase
MNPTLKSQLKSLKTASYNLQLSDSNQRNKALELIKEMLLANADLILESNKKDLSKMSQDDPLYDRLLLTEKRIEAICTEMNTVIDLEDPLNLILDEHDGPSGIHLQKTSVPLGCIGIIYEARPNVTVDVSSLCLKSGNAVLLRGSSSAIHSNTVIVSLIQSALANTDIPKEAVQLLDPDHKLAGEMMKANDYLDLIIPRGGKKLIERVRRESTVPTIETGASVVHTFIDESANIAMACNIIHNEKTRRPSVCNALDTVLIHEDALEKLLPALAEKMKDSKTIIHCDEKSFEILKEHYPSKLLKPDASEHLDHEFLSLEMNVITVSDIKEAIQHIRVYSLNHSESIVTSNQNNAKKFQREVDAACVYVNTSTTFSDGAQFGLGAEIGISTQKLHARGPMGLKELTSYKWLINSEGLIRK